MRTGYYPWNLKVLIEWLDEERPRYPNPLAFAEALGISLEKLRTWSVSQLPLISLEDLNALAAYRGSNLENTALWLGITQNHLYVLMEGSRSERKP